MARILQGQSYQWQLGDRPIGSGDAGEVYTASCVDAPEIKGVVKKPARVATGGTIQRQAGQIAQEAKALLRLNGLPQGKAHPPRLLDAAPKFTVGTANYFLVSEAARGESLDALLAQTRQAGKPFPRRVIVTVLDALFDLFARAHQAGVLWNDVKLDHIYWHNPTGGVTVIDWGNAMFLDQPETGSRPTPPRWEDYRQFVKTLGAFLQSSAPDLYDDLGWGEFTGAKLDLPSISILARRIAYQQEVIALKVMEYQSLIRVILSADPDLDGLRAIREYQEILEKIGAPWPRQDVLRYGKNLAETQASERNIQASLNATAILFEIFGETLNLPWHLLREIFRQPNLVAHPDLPMLVKDTLNQNWEDALWRLVSIADSSTNTPWWDQLVPLLRQKAVGLVTPPPFNLYHTLLQKINSQKGKNQNAVEVLNPNRLEWRKAGKGLHESPFDYSLLESLSKETTLPQHLRLQLKESYAVGKKAIGGLLQAWVEMNWEELDQNLKRILAWDPDRWAVLDLSGDINAFLTWLKQLYEGPKTNTSTVQFIQSMQNQQPPVHKVLGRPRWFHSLNQTLSQLTHQPQTKPPINALKNWCPWVIHDPTQTPAKDNDAVIAEMLSHYQSHLRSWSDVDAGLQVVREHAPSLYPVCKKIAEGFDEVLSLNFDPAPFISLCTKPPHPALSESCETLDALIHWRMSLSQGDLESAEKWVCHPSQKHWQIIHHACETTRGWRLNLIPLLHKLLNLDKKTVTNDTDSINESLVEIFNEVNHQTQIWSEIYRTGFHRRWLEALEESIEKVRIGFLAWRNGREHSSDPFERIFYHSQLALMHKISARQLFLFQHSRLAHLSFRELEKIRVQRAYQPALLDKILSHLSAIEAVLLQDSSEHKFPDWQAWLDQIRDTSSSTERKKVVLSLPVDHPLYIWLVDSNE